MEGCIERFGKRFNAFRQMAHDWLRREKCQNFTRYLYEKKRTQLLEVVLRRNMGYVMKRLHVFEILACILLLGLSGCLTSARNYFSIPNINSQWKANQAKNQAKMESSTEFLEAWKGHHVSKAIQRLGPATQITGDEAGGRIYIWELQQQKRVPTQVTPPKPQTQAQTRATMRWNSLSRQWEYESETGPKPQSFSDLLLDMQRSQRWEMKTYNRQLMFFTRADGTIYHWLIK